MFKSINTTACAVTLTIGVFLMPVVALAQADMSCADYLKADTQMQASMSPADKAQLEAALQSDPQAAALDAKMKAYCKAHPKASSSEAMMKVAQ